MTAVEFVKLGARALSSFRVWMTILLWTLFYADGAGFGAALYRNECLQPENWPCPLVHHALFPPQVSIATFLGNILALWFDGMYDSGLMVALFLTIILMLTASQMTRYVAERVFSWPVVLLGCAVSWTAGYYYEIHQTLSSGVARVPLF